MSSISRWCSAQRGLQRIETSLNQMSAASLVEVALTQGDTRGISRSGGKYSRLPPDLKGILSEMQVVLKEVEGSEVQRAATVSKLRALRVWNGCTFLFFTLNPHDHKSPLLVGLVSTEDRTIEKLTFPATDLDFHDYFQRHKEGNQNFFKELVAKHPAAAMR